MKKLRKRKQHSPKRTKDQKKVSGQYILATEMYCTESLLLIRIIGICNINRMIRKYIEEIIQIEDCQSSYSIKTKSGSRIIDIYIYIVRVNKVIS